MQRRLGHLRSQGHDVLVLRVLDPAELTFPYDHAEMFRDMETGRELYVDPATARSEYLAKFSAHAEAIACICRNHGIELSVLTTDQPLELALFDLLRARANRGREVARHTPAGRGGSTRGGG